MAKPAPPSSDDETYNGTPFNAPAPGSALDAGDEEDRHRTDVVVPAAVADQAAQKAETSGQVEPPAAEPPPRPAAKPPTRTASRRTPKVEAKPAAKASAKAAPPPPPAPEPPPRPVGKAASSRRAKVEGQADKAASSRRTAVSGKQPISPEEKAKRNKLLLTIGGSVLGVALLAAGIVWLGTSGSDHRRVAQDVLTEAKRQFSLAQSTLGNRRPEEARAAYEAALKQLTACPELGNAAEMPPLEDPVLVKDLARQAWELRQQVEGLKGPLTDLEAESRAEANLAALQARIGRISDPASDVDVLERDLRAFMANPVDPKAGPDETRAAAFARLANQAKLRLADVEAEQGRRKQARAVTPVRLAEQEIDGLIREERFGNALARLDELGKANPGADFAPLRAAVNDAAGKAWGSAKAFSENQITDWKAPGSGEAMRRNALLAAKKRLGEVVDRFGIAAYTDQAKEMLAKLP